MLKIPLIGSILKQIQILIFSLSNIQISFTYQQINSVKKMKTSSIFLVAGLLFGLVCSMSLKSHETNQLSEVEHLEHREQHEQAEVIAAQVAGELLKKLIEDPYKAAQIPTQFIQGSIDGMKGVFEGAWNIKDRTRSLQLTFVNLIGRDVVVEESYFDSGTWFQSWNPIIKTGTIVQGTVANRQGSWFTGVTGGMRLKVQGTNMYIYLGFNNPYIGGYKFYAELSQTWRPAKYGYDHSNDNNMKNTQFAGYRLQAVQTPSTITQMAFVYEISKADY